MNSRTSSSSRRKHELSRKIKIRRASTRDIDILIDQRRRMFEDLHHWSDSEHEIGDRTYRRWALDLMRRKLFAGFIAFLEGSPVAGGCVWLREIQPRPGLLVGRSPYLLSMYTKPEYRGLGLATRIVREAMKWSKSQGYGAMSLHASKLGRRVYKKIGWRRTWEMSVRLGGRPSPARRRR